MHIKKKLGSLFILFFHMTMFRMLSEKLSEIFITRAAGRYWFNDCREISIKKIYRVDSLEIKKKKCLCLPAVSLQQTLMDFHSVCNWVCETIPVPSPTWFVQSFMSMVAHLVLGIFTHLRCRLVISENMRPNWDFTGVPQALRIKSCTCRQKSLDINDVSAFILGSSRKQHISVGRGIC